MFLEKLLFTGTYSFFFSRVVGVVLLFIWKIRSGTSILDFNLPCIGSLYVLANSDTFTNLRLFILPDENRVYFPNQRHLVIIYVVDTIYTTFHAELISQNRPLVSAPNIVLACYMYGTKTNFSFQCRIFWTWIRPLFVARYDARFLVSTLFSLYELPHYHVCMKQTVLRSILCVG